MSGSVSKWREFFGGSDLGPNPLVRRSLDVVGSQPVASVVAVDAAQERDVVVATRQVGHELEPREPKVQQQQRSCGARPGEQGEPQQTKNSFQGVEPMISWSQTDRANN